MTEWTREFSHRFNPHVQVQYDCTSEASDEEWQDPSRDDDATSAQSPEASAALPQLLVGPLCFDYDSLQELEDLGRFDAVFRMVPSVAKSVSHPALS